MGEVQKVAKGNIATTTIGNHAEDDDKCYRSRIHYTDLLAYNTRLHKATLC